jgi:hypothetical protein
MKNGWLADEPWRAPNDSIWGLAALVRQPPDRPATQRTFLVISDITYLTQHAPHNLSVRDD